MNNPARRLFSCSALTVLLMSTLPAGVSFARSGRPLPAQLHHLNAYVRKTMHLWHVPGLALAVVQDGHLVYARGYGYRVLGQTAPVNPQTLFTLGSLTKAFTVAALGQLVTSGKLHWDTPAHDELRDFRLESAYVTQMITLRDLLTHRSGYCDPTAMWYTSYDTVQNVLWRLRYQKPSYAFRTHFCYNNTLYLAASQFIPALTGLSWNRYVQAHLFRPLDMKGTVTRQERLAGQKNVAAPYAVIGGRVLRIPRYWTHNMDVFAPVGGINTSVLDMSHWIEMLMDQGRYRGTPILSPSIIRAMETPWMLIHEGNPSVGTWLRIQTPGEPFYAYGLGFFIQEYGGHRLVWHPGNIDGMSTVLAIVPSLRLGVVVLSNLDQNFAPEGILFHVLQSYLGLPHRDISRAWYHFLQKQRAKEKAIRRKLVGRRERQVRLPVPLARYVGLYRSRFDGTAQVKKRDGRLTLTLGNPAFHGTLVPWNPRTFEVHWQERYEGTSYVTFDLSPRGQPEILSFVTQPLHYRKVLSTRRTVHHRR